MQKFTTLFAITTALLISACSGPTVDKQFANRQVSYIDIQPGPKINVMQLTHLKDPLQQRIISKLQGRGKPPAVGLTVRVFEINLPSEQIFGEALLGPGYQKAYIVAEGELWDATTRAPLTKFEINVAVPVRRATSLASVLGYPRGTEPDTADTTNQKLLNALAEKISISLYGYGDK